MAGGPSVRRENLRQAVAVGREDRAATAKNLRTEMWRSAPHMAKVFESLSPFLVFASAGASDSFRGCGCRPFFRILLIFSLAEVDNY